jgi:hypothetical protein
MPRDKETYNAYMRSWTEKNKDRLNAERRARRLNDPVFADKERKRNKNRKDGKNRRKNTRLKAMYGIDLDTYTEMYKTAGGCCSICNNKFESLVVDHDHTSGFVRGLLCSPCNVGLGMFKDNGHNLLNAIIYLQKCVPA